MYIAWIYRFYFFLDFMLGTLLSIWPGSAAKNKLSVFFGWEKGFSEYKFIDFIFAVTNKVTAISFFNDNLVAPLPKTHHVAFSNALKWNNEPTLSTLQLLFLLFLKNTWFLALKLAEIIINCVLSF
jgi:hypothetical protein